MEQTDPTQAYDWERDVRDPAKKSTEGLRVIEIKPARAEYEIAPLPDGRWAMRRSFSKPNEGSSTPWEDYESREAALDAFLKAAEWYFRDHQKMIERLTTNTLFGFEEPDPQT